MTELGNRVRAYMAESMAMPNPDEDQEQNWIFGHLMTFAIQLREGEAAALDASLDTDVIVDTSSLARTVPVYPRTVVPVKAQPHPWVDDDSPALAGSGAPPQPPTWLCAECRQQWLALPVSLGVY